MADEEKNTELIEKLKNLPKIKTSDDFILKLESRIAEFEAEKISIPVKAAEENSFWKLFGQNRNQWLVPAMGLIILAVFTFSIIKFNETQTEDKSVLSETKTGIPIDKNSIENNKGNSTLSEGNTTPNGNIKSETEIEKDKLKGKTSATDRETEIKKNYPVPVESSAERITKNKITSSPPEIKSTFETELSKKENTTDINETERKKENESSLGEETGAMKPGVTTSEPNAKEDLKRSSEKDTEEFEGAIEKSIVEKLNKVNKQKLDSLKKKINKP